MKWIDINKVRGLEIDQIVFVKDTDNDFSCARLIKIEQTKDGVVKTFDVAVFGQDYSGNGEPCLQTNITHVAIPG